MKILIYINLARPVLYDYRTSKGALSDIAKVVSSQRRVLDRRDSEDSGRQHQEDDNHKIKINQILASIEY